MLHNTEPVFACLGTNVYSKVFACVCELAVKCREKSNTLVINGQIITNSSDRLFSSFINFISGAITTRGSPTIAVINTYFSNPNDNNNFDSWNGSPTWKTCSSSSVCTEAPFTGTCSAVDSGNAKLGVNCACATSNKFDCVVCGPGRYKQNSNAAAYNDVCVSCGVGKFNNLEGQSDEAVACKNCSTGKFNNLEARASCKNCSTGKFNDLQDCRKTI